MTGACISGSAQVGIMAGASICAIGGHVQVAGQVGASSGIGASVGVGAQSTQARSPSDLGGVGGGGGYSACVVVCGGTDIDFTSTSYGSVRSETTSIGLGIDLGLAPVPLPAEGHAYGSFTVDLNDLVYALTHP